MDIGLWSEKYRPRSLDEIINHEKNVSLLKGFVVKKEMTHLLFVGPNGVGKITCILALANDFYGSNYHNFIKMLNVSDEPLLSEPRRKEDVDEYIKELINFARTAPIASPISFKMIILDDAEKLRENIQQSLRRTMEMYTHTCRFCLISTNPESIIEPIKSRCNVLEFKPLNVDNFNRLLTTIAAKENLILLEEGMSVLYNFSKGDMRKAINLLQASAVHVKEVDDIAIYNVLSKLAPQNIRKMIKLSIEGNMFEAREVLRSLLIDEGMDPVIILEMAYHEIMRMNEISKQWKIKITDIVSEIDYRLAKGSNERSISRCEVHLFTLLTKLALIEL